MLNLLLFYLFLTLFLNFALVVVVLVNYFFDSCIALRQLRIILHPLSSRTARAYRYTDESIIDHVGRLLLVNTSFLVIFLLLFLLFFHLLFLTLLVLIEMSAVCLAEAVSEAKACLTTASRKV